MVKLYGEEYSKEDLLTRVGDISQIAGVRLQTLEDGSERGVRTADFRTGSGLNFKVVIDKGMDISTADYRGQSLAWKSSTGDVHPAYYVEPGIQWLRNFSGGLVVTCGLTYAGAPTEDQGKALGLHGRASNLPAWNVCADAEWQDDGSYEMWVQGKTRETAVFGEDVQLARRVSAKLGESRIWLHDKVTNLGHADTEHMIVYHCNFGFPVVDKGSRLIAPVSECIPNGPDAEAGKENYAVFTEPKAGIPEEVFFLEMAEDKDGFVTVALVNSGFGIYMKYLKSELPRFQEWKMMGQGTYVVGLEPANCWVQGRDKERARGTLQFLKPGESREYHLEIGVLETQDEIKAIEDQIKAIRK